MEKISTFHLLIFRQKEIPLLNQKTHPSPNPYQPTTQNQWSG
jgi:hypothetical protein